MGRWLLMMFYDSKDVEVAMAYSLEHAKSQFG
jgi:hypothetical protein